MQNTCPFFWFEIWHPQIWTSNFASEIWLACPTCFAPQIAVQKGVVREDMIQSIDSDWRMATNVVLIIFFTISNFFLYYCYIERFY